MFYSPLTHHDVALSYTLVTHSLSAYSPHTARDITFFVHFMIIVITI